MASPTRPVFVVPAAKKKGPTLSWQEQVLEGIGAPLTPANVKFLDAWQLQEGTSAANNPLATTMGATGATDFNSVHVRNYPDAATGIDATIRTLRNYSGIVAAFKTGDASKSAAQYVGDFARWSGNTNDPAAANHYVSSILGNVGAPPSLLPSTPGASTTQASVDKAAAVAQAKRDANKVLNPPQTPAEIAQHAVDVANAKAAVTTQRDLDVQAAFAAKQREASLAYSDPYVTAKGGLSRDVKPPDDALESLNYAGQKMRQSEFDRLANTYAETYYAYTGKPLTASVLAGLAKTPKSLGNLRATLAEQPGFTSSPQFQANAPEYVAAARALYGADYKPSVKLLRGAITRGISADAFKDELRQLPAYEQSEGFKQQAANLSVSYQNIYGTPDANGLQVVHQATKHGFDATQFEQYLRAQPTYTQSNEYQTKTLGLLSALGLLTGGTAVLQPGKAAPNPNMPVAPLPANLGHQAATGWPQDPSAPQPPPTADNNLVPRLVGSKGIVA